MTSQLPCFAVAHRCAWCNRLQSHASAVTKNQEPTAPAPGDLLLCIECGQWSVVAGPLGQTRRPTKRDRREMERQPIVRDAMAAWLGMNKWRARQ